MNTVSSNGITQPNYMVQLEKKSSQNKENLCSPYRHYELKLAITPLVRIKSDCSMLFKKYSQD